MDERSMCEQISETWMGAIEQEAAQRSAASSAAHLYAACLTGWVAKPSGSVATPAPTAVSTTYRAEKVTKLPCSGRWCYSCWQPQSRQRRWMLDIHRSQA